MNNLETVLFRALSDVDNPTTIELMNYNHEPVCALYLSDMNQDNITISETNNKDRYLMYYYGVGVYFTYWRKLNFAK